MRKLYYFFIAFSALLIGACNHPPVEEEVDPSTLEKLDYSVPVTSNWIFESVPSFTLQAKNPNSVAVDVEVTVEIRTDKGGIVTTLNKSGKASANGTTDIDITADEALDPGFYKARVVASALDKKKIARSFVFGVRPTAIVSAPDKQADFDEFWSSTLSQLEAIDMAPRLVEVSTSGSRKIYLVEFNSIPDGLSGEPVKVRGYYCEPQDGQKHPVLMHFFGYDSNPPGAMGLYSGVSADYAEMYMCTRGQMINARAASQRGDGVKEDYTNIYGDWFAAGFGQRDAYYYRGAFMDCVQAVRFMATRPTSDMNNLYAEGSSQGGALSYATAALSPYPFNAIAPNVAFLGDFPDYFQIVSWPGNTAKAKKDSMTDEEMYAFLSYFDTKNLATRLGATAVLATIGLQDGTCPPHTNIAPYNNIPHSNKEIHYYPEMEHSYPPNWDAMYLNFFKKYQATTCQ